MEHQQSKCWGLARRSMKYLFFKTFYILILPSSVITQMSKPPVALSKENSKKLINGGENCSII